MFVGRLWILSTHLLQPPLMFFRLVEHAVQLSVSDSKAFRGHSQSRTHGQAIAESA